MGDKELAHRFGLGRWARACRKRADMVEVRLMVGSLKDPNDGRWRRQKQGREWCKGRGVCEIHRHTTILYGPP